MRIIELFAGIGACSKALKRIGVDLEIIDAVEIDKYAMASFNAIHGTNFETQDITEWNKDFKDIDIITHGSPCQDFSVAGKQAGGDIDSGTRSSLMYETIRIVGKIRPKYVLWENVKNLLSKKHKHNFDAYIETMNVLGYNSYYQVLNAKDYGIPQNRERVYTISIRKDIDNGSFKFPEKEELKLRLKDMLEDEVDEKYYLSEEVASKYVQSKENNTNVIGNLVMNKWQDNMKRIYDIEKYSPALNTMQGGNTEPKVLTYSPYVNKKYEEFINENGYIPEMFNPYNKSEIKDIAPTLTAQGDSITKSGTILKIETDEFDESIMTFEEREGVYEKADRVYDEEGLSPTLQCNDNMRVVLRNKNI